MRVDFLTSNQACAEGAIVAGLKVYVGYPITPSSDLFEYLAKKLPNNGGIVFNAEDEISSINALVGAAWAGAKAMTATSGPGFSLMQEGIGYAVILEAPIVIVNVMRAGPSLGIATRIGQGDIMQSKWGSHGPYELVVYAPASAQEAFDYTVKAFNTAAKVRVPVIVLMDAVLAHTREKVVLKDRDELEILEIKKPRTPPEEYKPFEGDPTDLVPSMAVFGEGYFTIGEALIHDERGYYIPDPVVYRNLVSRLVKKVKVNKEYIISSKSYYTDDAEVVFVAIGSMARSTLALIKDLRENGVKAGLFKPISVWPIDDKNFVKTLKNAKKVVVVELNQGQLINIIKNVLWDNKLCDIELYQLSIISSELPSPDDLLNEIKARGWKLW